ncbi:MAG: sigma 54-interacting transcriptional regulator [Tissierellia bacterium]|nr:sigma 54-interacting transcriptional regulator [Tissierellia bacterium]
MFNKDYFEEILVRSHKRCLNNNLKRDIKFPKRILSDESLKLILEKNKDMIKIALPFMKILYDFLKGSGFSLYVTDKDGIVLTIIGDEDIIDAQAETGIKVGTDMSEESVGTNAIGTALYENCSLQLSGKEHYINIYQRWTCSAAVIHDDSGNIIGCLNLTGKSYSKHLHTLGLVVAAVKSIENQLKVLKTQYELYNAYKYLNKVMDSINSGIFAADTNGVIKAINKSLCKMLCVEEEKIINNSSEIILKNWKHILEELKEENSYECKEIVLTINEKRKRYHLSVYPINDNKDNIVGMVAIFNDMKDVYNLVNKYTGMTATYTFDDIIGKSASTKNLKRQAKNISDSPSTVLIQGESGTGKELIAQAIHNNSNRRNNNFVAINCGAIPKNLIESELFGYEEGAFTGAKKGVHYGKFELASGGTLFLDEIGEMPLDMQVSLLRVLQEGCVSRLGSNKCIYVDVRIIAATNKKLKDEIKKGNFREDLYYRLNVIPIHIAPLRERKDDIELLINYFLKEKVIKLGKPMPIISKDLYNKLINYSWPGNIREMENCIENIVNLNGNTTFNFENNSIDNNNTKAFDYSMCSLKEIEENAIISCVEKCNGNITKASKILGINRSTIYYKINNMKK